jgi:N-acetyl-anhydromuramyl-L-alanine amidase AmpD
LKYVVGHDEIAGDEIRGKGLGKVDPGKHFDWRRRMRMFMNR